MEKINYSKAIYLVNKFANDASYKNNSEQEKERYLAVLPLANNQAILLMHDVDENGKISVSYLTTKNVFIGKRMDDAVLEPEIVGKEF